MMLRNPLHYYKALLPMTTAFAHEFYWAGTEPTLAGTYSEVLQMYHEAALLRVATPPADNDPLQQRQLHNMAMQLRRGDIDGGVATLLHKQLDVIARHHCLRMMMDVNCRSMHNIQSLRMGDSNTWRKPTPENAARSCKTGVRTAWGAMATCARVQVPACSTRVRSHCYDA